MDSFAEKAGDLTEWFEQKLLQYLLRYIQCKTQENYMQLCVLSDYKLQIAIRKYFLYVKFQMLHSL